MKINRSNIRLYLTLIAFALTNFSYANADEDVLDALNNPANTARMGKSDDVLVAVQGGLYLDDSQNALSEINKAVNMTIEALSTQGVLLIVPGQQQELINQYEKIDGKQVLAAADFSFSSTLPIDHHAIQLNIDVSGRGAGTFIFDPEDAGTIQFATIGLLLGVADLKSRIAASMVILSDLGLSYSRSIDSRGDFSWGASLKFQSISLVERLRSLDEYEESELLDWGRDVKNHYKLNGDVGVAWQKDFVRVSTAVKNIFPGDFRGPLGGHYKLRPAVKFAAEFSQDRFVHGVHWDVNPDQGFGVLRDSQQISATTTYGVSENLDVGLGYNYVQKGDFVNSYELSLKYKYQPIYFQAIGRFAARAYGFGIQAQMLF